MARPRTTAGIAFGGDYNPEQWPEHVWSEDVELMRRAGVDLVTVGVFSWALLEPRPDEFHFGWLDRVIARLDSAGLRVDLATATASPPPWLAALHPETLPVTYDGRRMWPGGRQGFCPSSPAYHERSLALVRALAERYGRHPALALWHVGNELGGHNVHCYCDISAEAFRQWLRRRYGTLDQLNEVWATAFWSQRYGAWEEIWPPRLAPTFTNPTQQLDYRRFSSDELLDNYRREKALLRRLSPDVPVTTNFMVIEGIRDMDYWSWADEVDVVSNDHYLRAANPDGHIELAFSADLTRGLAGGRPWLLMEHSTSAVNWQPRNVAKAPGEMTRNSLQHVARGADGVLFFQWRASQAGAEKFHSALVPHAGTDTKIFREVVELGGILDRLGEVAGSTVTNDVAMLFDWQCWWAVELDSHPSVDVRYLDRLHAHYRALWEAGIGVDLVHPEQDLTPYRLVIVPTLYAVSDTASSRLHDAVEHGTTTLVTYFSGIVDPNDHVRLGGYPGAFRELLGIRTEEFFPLREAESVRLSDGHTADVWTELLELRGAQEVASYVDGPLPGVPAVTRHRYGAGTAWYVATRLDHAGVQELTTRLCADAGVTPVATAPPGVERVRRVGSDASWLFLVNHTDRDVEVPATGQELVTGERAESQVRVPAGGVAVVREAPAHPSAGRSDGAAR
ncbi:MAG: beta-galactosidase [Actinomycetota bacterium]|nr:beta-galactosidase [Actinomycetota bacterium]